MKSKELKKLDRFIKETRKETRFLHVPKQRIKKEFVVRFKSRIRYSHYLLFNIKAYTKREAIKIFKAKFLEQRRVKVKPFSYKISEV